MADTVTLPHFGPTPTKYVYGGGALVLGVAGYAYWRRANHPPAAADPGLASATDPAASGEGVSDGSVWPWAPPGGSTVSGNPPAGPTSNTEWAVLAVNALTGLGYEPIIAGQTIGKYLDRRGLTTDEQLLIRTAWGQVGHPPNDLPIIPAPSTPTTTTPGVTGPFYTTGWHAIGKVGQRYSLRDVAQKSLPSDKAKNPTAVESKLRQILAHPNNKPIRDNWGPTTKGKYGILGIPGGTRVYIP